MVSPPKQVILRDTSLGLTLTLTIDRSAGTVEGQISPGGTAVSGAWSPEGMTLQLKNGTVLAGTFEGTGERVFAGQMLVGDEQWVFQRFRFCDDAEAPKQKAEIDDIAQYHSSAEALAAEMAMRKIWKEAGLSDLEIDRVLLVSYAQRTLFPPVAAGGLRLDRGALAV